MVFSNKSFPIAMISVPAIVLMAGPGFAMVYLTVSEAQQLIFPGEHFTEVLVSLTLEEQKVIKEKGGLAVSKNQSIWKTDKGQYFIMDKVIGKHELITYAIGIDPDGSIRQIEIMEYREAHGNEVRQKKWRKQFIGKTISSPFQFNRDIRNISGATLSCRHVTEGVKRSLALYDTIIKKQNSSL
ncbi:MAG: FMN-binding protein [Candidatus Omnitrophica bacterium]|nr:FMN-binding protein [Candidatus Omnitrophota bacterium]